MSDLVSHLETYCGTIERGLLSEADAGFQIVEFSGGPSVGTKTISTLGLSRHDLALGDGRIGHQELLMLFLENQGLLTRVNLLRQVAKACLDQRRAVLRGDLIRMGAYFFEGYSYDALYATIPVYFPDEFASYDDIVMAWLIPIMSPEREYIERYGWRKFENLLQSKDPDLTDIERQSIVE